MSGSLCSSSHPALARLSQPAPPAEHRLPGRDRPDGWLQATRSSGIPKYDYLVINDKVANAVHMRSEAI